MSLSSSSDISVHKKRYSPKIVKFERLSNEQPEEMNLYPATAYLKHFFISRSPAGYGVHSPFIFNFLTEVVKGETDNVIINEAESLRREMLADKSIIRVTDLGMGSAVMKGHERSFSAIASIASLPVRQIKLLTRIAAEGVWSTENKKRRAESSVRETDGGGQTVQNNGVILELGTSLGISALALALAAPEMKIVTVEGCPALAEKARDNLHKHGAHNAEVLNMEFSDAIDKLQSDGTVVKMAFIDGNHRGEALRQYIKKIRSMGKDMIIIADDIHLNRDMYTAWRAAAASEESHSAMETYRLGILFCFQSITPGYYYIRH